MSSKGQAFALPSYDEIPLSEHRQTLKLVLEVTDRKSLFGTPGLAGSLKPKACVSTGAE
jgi:hypothetical protein